MSSTHTLSEKEFMSQVIQLAQLFRWKIYHTHNSRKSVAGFPDLLMLRGAKMIVAELKVGRNKITSDQADWLTWFRVAGAKSYLWTPDHWSEIESVLKG